MTSALHCCPPLTVPLCHHFFRARAMIEEGKDILDHFWLAGISYKKNDTYLRGVFALNNEHYAQLLTNAPAYGVNEVFVISTCNRTEIYGFARSADTLTHLLCSHTQGDEHLFAEQAYIKNGMAAVSHLYEVGAGLDSQILGDYEILGQIKKAVKLAKQHQCIKTITERLVNSVIQASKAVKTRTELSSGTISVSYAAVLYIRQLIGDVRDKNIVLVGTGKIGAATCRHLVDYLNTRNITLINRTESRALELAEELRLNTAPIEEISGQLHEADIVLVSTNADAPIIFSDQLHGHRPKLVIDLCVPGNVAEDARKLVNVTYVDVDALSKINDGTLESRKAEVPKALTIVDEHIAEFKEWYHMRKHAALLNNVKNKLNQLHPDACLHVDASGKGAHMHREKVQKIINNLAVKMRRQSIAGCHYIEALNEYMS
jgi:glutamyl-tRNA reductase